MAALAEMPRHEQAAAEDSPALNKFREAMGASRFARMMATYILVDELERAHPEQHAELISRYAKAAGTSMDAMRVDLRWAREIPENILRGVFAAEAIPELEWSERITISHLRAAGRAQHPTGRPLDPMERAAWLLSAYDADETSGEFEDRLRALGYLKARKRHDFGEDAEAEEEHIQKGRAAIAYLIRCMGGDYGPTVAQKIVGTWQRRTKNLVADDSLARVLEAMATSLRENGQDVGVALKGPGPFKAAATLRKAADLLDARRPGAEFTLTEEVQRP